VRCRGTCPTLGLEILEQRDLITIGRDVADGVPDVAPYIGKLLAGDKK